MLPYMRCHLCDDDIPIRVAAIEVEASTHLQLMHRYAKSITSVHVYNSDHPFDDIPRLARMINDTAHAKGWWADDRHASEILMNIAAEVSEAWEEWRKKGYTQPLYYEDDVVYHLQKNPDSNSELGTSFLITPAKPEGLVAELADTIIRILDFCEQYEWDIVAVLQTKMEYNQTRSYRHGGKLA